jgi:hypothetical protein
MPMKGRTKCAVLACSARISGYGNLCDSHRIPGAIVRMGDNTMIIAAWEVEHEHESGIVFLNDFASGDLFGGRAGFEAKLREQGFVNDSFTQHTGTLGGRRGSQSESEDILW